MSAFNLRWRHFFGNDDDDDADNDEDDDDDNDEDDDDDEDNDQDDNNDHIGALAIHPQRVTQRFVCGQWLA